MAKPVESTTDVQGSVPVRRLKWLLLGSSLATIVFLAAAAYQEHFGGPWRTYQHAYRDALLQRAATPQARRAAASMDIGFKQIYLPHLERIDRCNTCHIGIDDPRQTAAAQPLRTHSGATLTQHPLDKFGCTVCHDGQGRAIALAAAHGTVEDWPQPLLRGEMIFTSCGRCHYDNDLFGAEYELFTPSGPLPPIDQAELLRTLPGAKSPDEHAVGRGKQLVLSHGCLGCHQYRGRGGQVGTDLTHEGDKTAHDFDFTHVPGEHTTQAWQLAHFQKPSAVTPGTLMPDMAFTAQQAQDLACYMLSLHRKGAPAALTPVPPRDGSATVAAPQLFALFCSACHGPEGRGSHYFDDRNTNVPVLRTLAERLSLFDAAPAKAAAKILREGGNLDTLKTNPDLLKTSPDFADSYPEFRKQLDVMRDVIRKGRPGIRKNAASPLAPVNMPSWRATLTDRQIDAILAYLIDLYPWKD